MKTAVMLVVLALSLALPAVAATEIDGTCEVYGFGTTLARWDWDGDSFELAYSVPDHGSDVTGDDSNPSWTADPAVAGIVTRDIDMLDEGFIGNYFTHDGGSAGSLSPETGYDVIGHVYFCDEGASDVPEFSTVVLFVTIVGAVAGLIAFRK